jgi:hypothetical protein
VLAEAETDPSALTEIVRTLLENGEEAIPLA